MGNSTRYVPDILAVSLIVFIHWRFWGWTRGHRRGKWLRAALSASFVWIVCGFVLALPQISGLMPPSYALSWTIGWAIAWGITLTGVFFAALVWRAVPRHDPSRRRVLNAARTALFAAPFAATGFGVFIERNRIRLAEIDIPVDDLPADLDGLRLVQISDIHLSPFLSERELARAVDMANETKAEIALVTGDLITARGDPLDACLTQLARLKSGAGTFGCLGNHEIYADAEAYTTGQGARLGIAFLRREARRLKFGTASINLVGVDYQRMGRTYLAGTERLVVPGDLNVLLSHNPDVFPKAAAKGFDVTLSGHTHGGQVTVEILSQYLSVPRFFTPYVYGLYRLGRAAEYVTRGIGTVGVPARIGAPPEIALIRLTRSKAQGTV